METEILDREGLPVTVRIDWQSDPITAIDGYGDSLQCTDTETFTGKHGQTWKVFYFGDTFHKLVLIHK